MRRLRWAIPGIVAVAAFAASQIAAGAQSQPASYKACLRNATSTVATEKCITTERARLKKAIAAAYAKVAARPTLGAHGVELLAAGQRAWRTFERRDCALPGWMVRGGTLAPVSVGECLVDRETQRLAELRNLTHFPG